MPAPLDLKAVLEELERTAPGASRVLLLAAATPGRRVVWPWVEGLVPDLTDDARAAVRHLLEVRGLVRDGADPPGATGTLGQEVAEAAAPLLTDEDATIDRYVIDRAEQVAEDQAGFPEPWEVDALLGVLSRPLGSNPGLVTQIPQFLRSVALAAPEDTRLRTILLDACVKLAGTGPRAEAEANARLADALHTTDPPTALTHYRRALEITRDLAGQHPDDPQLKRDTSVALNDISRMLRDTDPTQALAHYRESLEITEFLAEHYRDDSGRIRLDLCIALRNVAEMLTPIDPEQALALYRRSLDVNTELTDAWPHNLSLRHGLASSLNDIATLLSGTDPEQALGYYQRALGILRELAAAQPGNLQAAHDLAAALSNGHDPAGAHRPRAGAVAVQGMPRSATGSRGSPSREHPGRSRPRHRPRPARRDHRPQRPRPGRRALPGGPGHPAEHRGGPPGQSPGVVGPGHHVGAPGRADIARASRAPGDVAQGRHQFPRRPGHPAGAPGPGPPVPPVGPQLRGLRSGRPRRLARPRRGPGATLRFRGMTRNDPGPC